MSRKQEANTQTQSTKKAYSNDAQQTDEEQRRRETKA